MSLALRKMAIGRKLSRVALLKLQPQKDYSDGRTKQCHRDECDINKIMARFEHTGTISHLSKYEGVYADFADFDFHRQLTKLAEGETVFNSLPAEIRREFGQSPQQFFDYVNDPANVKDLLTKLPGLAAPGTQLPPSAASDADTEAVRTAQSEPASEKKEPEGS